MIRRVQQKPGDGSTHWSCRKLAHELGLSKSTVQRILAQARLKPHRLERYMASNDPDFEGKAADIIGLYLAVRMHWMWRKRWDYEQLTKFGSHAGQPGTGDGVQLNTD